MSMINRRDVISTGSTALAVSNFFPNKRPLGLILAAAILSLAGTISAQAKQHDWVEEEEDASHYAASFRMPAAGRRNQPSPPPIASRPRRVAVCPMTLIPSSRSTSSISRSLMAAPADV
jgi:hypothetical protein